MLLCFNLFSCFFYRTLLAAVLPNFVILRIYIVLRLHVGQYGHWRETCIYWLLSRILPSYPQLAPVASLFVLCIAAYRASLSTFTRKLYSRIDKPTVEVLELWVRSWFYCVFISWRLCGLGLRAGGEGGASSFRKVDLLTACCVCAVPLPVSHPLTPRSFLSHLHCCSAPVGLEEHFCLQCVLSHCVWIMFVLIPCKV